MPINREAMELLIELGDQKCAETARLGDAAIMEKLGGRMTTMEGRMEKVENRLSSVEAQVARAVELGEKAVEQGKEILSKFAGLEGEVHQVKEETREGIKTTTTYSRWKQTAKDFHLDKVLRTVWTVFLLWGVFKVVGWFGGPQLRDEIFEILKKAF